MTFYFDWYWRKEGLSFVPTWIWSWGAFTAGSQHVLWVSLGLLDIEVYIPKRKKR